MVNYTTKVIKYPIDLKREKLELRPYYGDKMYHVVSRLIAKPESARFIPRLFDVYLANFILSRKDGPLKNVEKVLDVDQKSYTLCLKFCRDIVDFVFDSQIPNCLTEIMGQQKL